MTRPSSARLAALACAMLTLSIAAPASASRLASVGDVRQAIAALAKIDGVVGAIGEVYAHGKRVGQGSGGSRLLDGKGGRIPSDARYRIGSQTKGMTATVLLQLVKEGKVSLEDKLGQVLPQVVQQDLVERADEITVRQLLQHTSGIPNSAESPEGPFDFTTHYRPADLVKATRGEPRTGEPGEKFSYSNTNYQLLGMIIEKLTGHSLSAEFDRRIFRPLGMTRTYLPTRPPQGIIGPHGHGYHPDAQGKPRDVDRINASILWAAGGVVSTARDVSTFTRASVQGKLLPPELQKEMPGPKGPGRVCGGTPGVTAFAGGAPGFTTVTYTTVDGRSQFAFSVTVSADNVALDLRSAFDRAAEAVFCPKNQSE